MADPTKLTKKEIDRIKNDRAIRKALAKSSHQWFFAIYLGHYIEYPFANFHQEMFAITEDETITNAVIVAFRGSGKSTLMTLSYPIWSIVGKQKKKFVLIISQTQAQARLHLANIRKELESNELLKVDIGPFQEISDEWGSASLVVSKYGARITIASIEQSVRGVRHAEFRPDLIICDDVEDLNSVKTKEGRDKTYGFIIGEVIPAGDQKTKTIIVGNLLHEDSLIMRLSESINNGVFDGIYKSFPLLDEDKNPLWTGKFPSQKEIDELKRKTPDEPTWQREYLLRIISTADRTVHPEWIHYYDELPKNLFDNLEFIATGIDLAISQENTGDFTAMVSCYLICDEEGNHTIYICPNPVNERLTFPQTIEKIKLLSTTLGRGQHTLLYVEDVGYQRSCIETLIEEGFKAEGVKLKGQDKRSRLALTTALIQNGTILFPRNGCEELIKQLTNFGYEKHDDLVDAFSLLILKIMEEMNKTPPQIYII